MLGVILETVKLVFYIAAICYIVRNFKSERRKDGREENKN